MLQFLINFWWVFIVFGVILFLGLLGYIFDHQTVKVNNTSVAPVNNDVPQVENVISNPVPNIPVSTDPNNINKDDIPINIG